MGFKRGIFQKFRRRVAVDMQRIIVCLQKEMFSTAFSYEKKRTRLIKVEKMTSNLKTLHDRTKRGLSEDMSVAPSFEAARNVKS